MDPNAVIHQGKDKENKRRALIKAVTKITRRQNRAKKQNKRQQGKVTT